MYRRLLIVSIMLTLLIVMLGFPNSARAASISYGPFSSGSSDSSTCGGNWANDTFGRLFTVDTVNPNVLVETFTNGTFITLAGASPNACKSGNNGTTVGAGIPGTFGGSFDISVSGGAYNGAAVCTPVSCATTAAFIATVYGAKATYITGATYFVFDYTTCGNGSWHNASPNRGGNYGDISGTLSGACAASSGNYAESPVGCLGLVWRDPGFYEGLNVTLYWKNGSGTYVKTTVNYITGHYGDIDMVWPVDDYSSWDNGYIQVTYLSLIRIKHQKGIVPDEGADMYKTNSWYQLRLDSGEVMVTFARLAQPGKHVAVCGIYDKGTNWGQVTYRK